MEKKTFTITVDLDILEAFKAKVNARERSATITEFMRNYVRQESPDVEEQAIIEQIDELIREREEIAETLNKLSTQLTITRSKNLAKKKEEEERVFAMYDSVMANNPMDR